MAPSGGSSTRREATILSLVPRRHAVKSGGRSLEPEEDSQFVIGRTADNIRVRVKLCLQSNHDTCGDYTEAESK